MSVLALAATVIILSAIADAAVRVDVVLEINGGAVKMEDHQVYLAVKTGLAFKRVPKQQVWVDSDEEEEANKREFSFLLEEANTLDGKNTWVVVVKKLPTQAGGSSPVIVGSEEITKSHKVTKPLLDQAFHKMTGGAAATYKVTVRVLRSLMD
ncbi:hypothetical protein DdX_21602 [Ditylenchus destructor]|uniref:Uncharacterized protein n=1 Tax=Ditylenchus destructor TaxID=166010 RepID=A0AAD4QVE9_9BILA|nr:hypothetical protein DdX_21602 [Ditylenchus destructor]